VMARATVWQRVGTGVGILGMEAAWAPRPAMVAGKPPLEMEVASASMRARNELKCKLEMVVAIVNRAVPVCRMVPLSRMGVAIHGRLLRAILILSVELVEHNAVTTLHYLLRIKLRLLGRGDCYRPCCLSRGAS